MSKIPFTSICLLIVSGLVLILGEQKAGLSVQLERCETKLRARLEHVVEPSEPEEPCLEPAPAPGRKATQTELARERTRRAMIAFTPMLRNSPISCLENDALVMADLDKGWKRIMRDMRRLAAEGY